MRSLSSSRVILGAAAAGLLGCTGGNGGGGGSADSGDGDADTGSEDGPDTGSGSGSGSSEEQGDEDSGEVGGMNTKWDLGNLPDAPGGCGGEGGGTDFSYIWIANSPQGTITKLDTESMVEHGRYYTRPDQGGSPSRTSVNLAGDVAVANRYGGITKVYAREADCVESNGMPGIQTSTGKLDILPWAQEECRAWFTPFNYSAQRPVAWTSGDFDESSCSLDNVMLWTSGANAQLDVVLLRGDDGTIDDVIPVPEVQPGGFGAYGGAVDLENDFWFMTYTYAFPLVEVSFADHTYEITNAPQGIHGYGITVDHLGRVWFGTDLGGVSRYDPETQQWDTVMGKTGLGIQEHPDGYMWFGTWPTTGIQAIDVDTMELGPFIPLASPSQTKGVSIDFYGYVWLVDMTKTAWRIDPDTLQFDTYTGLDSPYTYSDMTGWGLSNVANPQG